MSAKSEIKSNTQYLVEYRTWARMRCRCNNPNHQDWENYGGKGIRVCGRWDSFKNFLDDMGKRPGNGYCIDRIDVDGNYEPDNCRWITVEESNNNKGTTRRLVIGGVMKTLSEWSKESGTNIETIRTRLNRGWSEKDAVFGELKQEMLRVGNRWGKRIVK